ncbi:hypothetical protein BD311DRAFT_317850 [Dichomitus squalens]|uniref:Uncharacterized protein n=1 Tax=Dichomitus squalens TaxID=114155 RepID=A0A4Q9MM92_9APHY|nr:hypothetical protein BD311DRAFT_317850 [Dichomitus squalens]
MSKARSGRFCAGRLLLDEASKYLFSQACGGSCNVSIPRGDFVNSLRCPVAITLSISRQLRVLLPASLAMDVGGPPLDCKITRLPIEVCEHMMDMPSSSGPLSKILAPCVAAPSCVELGVFSAVLDNGPHLRNFVHEVTLMGAFCNKTSPLSRKVGEEGRRWRIWAGIYDSEIAEIGGGHTFRSAFRHWRGLLSST